MTIAPTTPCLAGFYWDKDAKLAYGGQPTPDGLYIYSAMLERSQVHWTHRLTTLGTLAGGHCVCNSLTIGATPPQHIHVHEPYATCRRCRCSCAIRQSHVQCTKNVPISTEKGGFHCVKTRQVLHYLVVMDLSAIWFIRQTSLHMHSFSMLDRILVKPTVHMALYHVSLLFWPALWILLSCWLGLCWRRPLSVQIVKIPKRKEVAHCNSWTN